MTLANYTADNGRTIRQQIIDRLQSIVEAMQDDGSDVWRQVFRGDLEDVDNDQCPVASIDFGDEQMLNQTYPCSEYQLPVFFHFRFRGQRGVDEHDLYQYYLGLLQRAILPVHDARTDPTLAALVRDIREVSNAHTIVGIEDVYPGGTLVVDVIYKTRLHNPYERP